MDSRYIYLEIGTTGKSAGSRGGNPGKSVEMEGPGVYGGGRSGNIYLGKKRKNRMRHTHKLRSLRPVWRCHGVTYIVTMDTEN